MRPARVAVAPGATTVRVAMAGAGSAARLVAELPAESAGRTAELLAEIVGPPPEELLLVHPVSWSSARVAAWAREAEASAGRVGAVPAPLAASAGCGVRAVLDVGHSGAEAVLLHGGVVVAHRASSAGGARLDEATAALLARRRRRRQATGQASRRAGAGPAGTAREARRLREELSLRPAAVARLPDGGDAIGIEAAELRAALTPVLRDAVAVLREVLASGPGGVGPGVNGVGFDGVGAVLLVGGVARAPLLAELVDAEGIDGAVVAPRPDAAAVLGALALPRAAYFCPEPGRGSVARPPVPHWLPPLQRRPRRPGRIALATVAATALAGALLGAGTALAPAPPAAVAVPAGELVQYGYRLDLPVGWEHTGGLPERRRSLLTPAAAPEGSDLIAVERTPLGYDAGAEPDRARSELRAEFDAAVAAGSPLSDYRPGVRAAGREVTTYRQRDGADRSVVEWFVVLDGDAQLSVGCRSTPSGAPMVRAACERVVASVRRV